MRRASAADSDRRPRARGDRLIGTGIAVYTEPCGHGWESAEVYIQPDGRIRAATGSSAQGQGRVTSYRQIVADVLRQKPQTILIDHGDTGTCPPGIGALASRSTADRRQRAAVRRPSSFARRRGNARRGCCRPSPIMST